MDTEESIKILLKRIEKRLKDQQEKKGIKASGKSADSLRTEATTKTGVLYGESYFYQQQNGRKAGSMPPISPIYEWLGLKKYGLDWKTDQERKSLAFAIAINMKKKGTAIHQNKSKGLELEKIINEEVSLFKENLTDEIKKEYIARIKETIVKK